MNIWQSLARPFLVMAPLEGVADTVYRQIIAGAAKPDIFVTEFTSADGFCSPGRDIVAENFAYTPIEQPIIAQVWGKNPETLYETAKAAADMGFAGIDINMGCPDRTVMKHGGGAAMIGTPVVAKAAIDALKTGVADSGHPDLPVSVKTRIGITKIETERWASFLLEQELGALTIHGRTAAELSKVPAHWDEIGKVVAIRDGMGMATPVIGNGDVKDAKEAQEKHNFFKVDGIMIGRGIFANLWAFDRSRTPHVGSVSEYLDVMERHIRLFDRTWGTRKNYAILKKFYKNYVNGFHSATEWRVRFMATNRADEALILLAELRQHLSV